MGNCERPPTSTGPQIAFLRDGFAAMASVTPTAAVRAKPSSIAMRRRRARILTIRLQANAAS